MRERRREGGSEQGDKGVEPEGREFREKKGPSWERRRRCSFIEEKLRVKGIQKGREMSFVMVLRRNVKLRTLIKKMRVRKRKNEKRNVGE